MRNRIQILLMVTLVFSIAKFTMAQPPNQGGFFLQSVGSIDSLYSKNLQEHRKIFVQLPSNYNKNSKEKYPVVFILDGEFLLPTVNNVQQFYSGGFTPEMVLIGISNADNRTRDLTPSKIKEKYGMPFNEESGGADKFITFLKEELIPFVEKKYPVTPFRTLIGHSYGGLFAIYTLINHPQLFTTYLSIDPSLDWHNQRILSEAQQKLATQIYNGKSLFVSLNGQLHMQNPEITLDNVMQDTSTFTLFARSNITFSNILKQNKSNGLAFEWVFYPRDIHGTIPFPSIMDGLIFVFDWYQMEHTDKFNSPTTSKEELFNVINYRATKLEQYFKYSFPPYPEDLFNTLGYMSLDSEQSEKAKMFFEFAIKFYPNSANAHDSMADYYERSNDYINALHFVTKAYTISNNEYYFQRLENLKAKIK